MMREAVNNLGQLGPLPDSEADEEVIAKYQALLEQITPPITNNEARLLVKLFGRDDCYGLAWTLLHLIETAPDWPIKECLEDTRNEWTRRLRLRAERGGKL